MMTCPQKTDQVDHQKTDELIDKGEDNSRELKGDPLKRKCTMVRNRNRYLLPGPNRVVSWHTETGVINKTICLYTEFR